MGERSVRPKVDEHFTNARRVWNSPLCLNEHLPETQPSQDAARGCWIKTSGNLQQYFSQEYQSGRTAEHTMAGPCQLEAGYGQRQLEAGYGQMLALQGVPMTSGTDMRRSVPATAIPEMRQPPAPARMHHNIMQDRADYGGTFGNNGPACRGDPRMAGAHLDAPNSHRQTEPAKVVIPSEVRHSKKAPSNQPPYQWPPSSLGAGKAYVNGGRELWTEYLPNDGDMGLSDSRCSSFSLKDLPAQQTDRRQSLEPRPPSIGRTVYMAAPKAGTACDDSRSSEPSNAPTGDSYNSSRLSEQSSIPPQESVTDPESLLECSILTDDGQNLQSSHNWKSHAGRREGITYGVAEVHTEVQAEVGHLAADPGDAAAGGGRDLSCVKYPQKRPRVGGLPTTLLPDSVIDSKDQTEQEIDLVMRQLSVRAQAELALLDSVWGNRTQINEHKLLGAEGLIFRALRTLTQKSLKDGFQAAFSGTEASTKVRKPLDTGKRSDEEVELEREIAELETQKTSLSADIDQLLKFEEVGLRQLNKPGTDIEEARDGATGPLPPDMRHFEQEALDADRSITAFEQRLAHIERLVHHLGSQYEILRDSQHAAAASVTRSRKYGKGEGLNALSKIV